MLKRVISHSNTGQTLFRDLVFGVLVYTLIIGLFDEYTNLISVKSFSYIIATSLIMQILTILTLGLKSIIVDFLKPKDLILKKPLTIFSVWLVMFFSKFVYLGVIDYIFGSSVDISGFFSLLGIILSVVALMQVIDRAYIKLGIK